MLYHYSHWRNAFEQNPFREARVVWFAKSNNPGPHAPDPSAQQPDPADSTNPETVPPPNYYVEQNEEENETRDPLAYISEKTRNEIDSRLSEIPLSETVRKCIAETDSAIEEVRTMLLQPSVIEEIKKLPQEEQSRFWSEAKIIDDWRENSGQWHAISSQLAEWDKLNMHPAEFRRLMETYYKGSAAETAVLGNIDAYLERNSNIIEQWSEPNLRLKMLIVRDLSKIADTNTITKAMDVQTADWNSRITALTKTLKESRDKPIVKLDQKAEQVTPAGFKGVFETLGISFHSPLEIWEAMKMVGESYKNALKERLRQKSTALAHQWGGILKELDPLYGKEVASDLEKQADSNDNKNKNEFKETLTDTNFMNLFEEGGILDSVRNDPPKSLAVLEHAASHGWLYDLSENSNPENVIIFQKFRRYRLQDLVPRHWSRARVSNYFVSLIGQNQTGSSNERESAKKRAERHDKFEPLMTEIKGELESHNYWGAIGVMETALGKGKAGHTSPRMATLIMRELRENEQIRRLISPEVVEKMGSWVFGQVPFTMSHYTMDKGDLIEWMNKNQPENMQESGVLGSSIANIEDAIRQKIGNDAAFDRLRTNHKDKLDDITARVLGTLTVDLNNELKDLGITVAHPYISIFEQRFTSYRQNLKMFEYYTNTTIAKEKDDYFTNDSEIPLLPQVYYDNILTVRSPGDFTDPAKAELFIGQIIKKNDELKAHLPEAYVIFQDEVRKKLNSAFDKIWDVTHSAILKRKYRSGKDHAPGYLVDTLISKKLLTNRREPKEKKKK